MNNLVELNYMFFTGDAAKLTGVHRSTVNRWLRSGKIKGTQLPNAQWLVSLEGINQGREIYGLSELSRDEAMRYYETGELNFSMDVGD
jgi:excisionase family DNA binding protein